MALVIYWYDFVCFAIVGGAMLWSLWVLRQKEGTGKRYNDTKYESLLVTGSDASEFLGLTRSGHVSSSHLWMSCWHGVHPEWLLGTRVVSAFVMGGFLVWDVFLYHPSVCIYYTEWTFTLTTAYFVLGSVISIHGCRVYSNLPIENDDLESDLEEIKYSSITLRTNQIRAAIKLQSSLVQEEVKRRAGFWGYLMQIAYQTCAGAVMLTDIVFWCLIVPFLSIEHFTLNLLMGCMHTLNAMFLLLDAALNSMPFPWFRLAYFVLWSCIYIIFQWILHGCGYSLWPYPFIELSTPWAPLWYFCLSLVHIPCYGLFALVVKAKNSICPRLFPHAYRRSY